MRVSDVKEHYDIVVIGGGLVGASFACALARAVAGQGVRILVTEAIESLQASPSFDARSTALSYGSQQIYQELGLWDELASYATAIAKIHVSDRGHFGTVRIDREEMGVEALGYVVENRHLGLVLNAALARAEAIDYLCPARISALTPTAQGYTVQMLGPEDTTSTLHADLVVLADGGKSSLSQNLGISSAVTHYEQSAIIANVAFADAHRGVAYERFTDSGPVAVLPLSPLAGEDRGALIWTVGTQEAAAIVALPEAEFLSRLQERFGHRLGVFTKCGARASYPLSLSVAREQIRPGLVLLGNVAHSLHPVAGQGLNLALRDAQALSQSLAHARGLGRSLGEMAVLQDYVQRQRRDQQDTIDFSHYMTRLFSSNNSALVWARKFGLFSIDLIPVFKRGFARRAMGLAQRALHRA